MDTKREDLKIYGKIVSASTEGVVAEAEQIYDDSATTYVNDGKQNSINKYFKTKQDQVITGMNSLNNKYDSVKRQYDSVKRQYDEIQPIPIDNLSQILKL